jgi:plastocyanin
MRSPGLVALLILSACGGGAPPSASSASAPTLHIVNFTYSPQRLEVAPGASVIVLNEDPVQHSVTSAAAPGTFTYGTVDGLGFDTGPFTGARVISIPGTATVGTVVPYFCWLHAGAMVNEGEIVVVAPP